MTNRDRTLLNRMICGMICILPLLLLLLHDCTEVPDYCSAHNPLDPLRQFCHEGAAVDKCGGKSFDPSKQVCDEETVKNQIAYLSVNIDPVGGGTVSLNPPSDDVSTNQNNIKYGYGLRTTVTATAVPDGDNEFIGWLGAETSGNVDVAVMMDGVDMTLTAKFKMKYMVTVSSDGTGATGSGSYAAGEMVTITTGTMSTDKVFKNWTTTNSGVTFADANSDTTTFTMPANAVTVNGNLYRTVVIGGKRWMAENLNYQTKPGEGNSWCYSNNNSNCETYGRLYDWNTAKTVCPTGWHLPSRDEWDHLAESADGTKSSNYGTWHNWLDAGKALKSTSGWNSGGNGTDAFGFSALPSGNRNPDGTFDNAGKNGGFWWTDTETSSGYAYYRNMDYLDDSVLESDGVKSNGFSVRCVADD